MAPGSLANLADSSDLKKVCGNTYLVDMLILITSETVTIFTLLKEVAHFNPEYTALRYSTTRNWQFRRVKLHSTNELNVLHKASFSQ
jgi:hypothetical protein